MTLPLDSYCTVCKCLLHKNSLCPDCAGEELEHLSDEFGRLALTFDEYRKLSDEVVQSAGFIPLKGREVGSCV